MSKDTREDSRQKTFICNLQAKLADFVAPLKQSVYGILYNEKQHLLQIKCCDGEILNC